MLTNPKYAGCLVFNRSSQTLGTKSVLNPPDKWSVIRNAFPAVVSPELFERTQAKIRNQVIRRTDEQLLAELRAYIQATGKGLPCIRKTGDLANAATYRYRFGSLLTAYKAVGYRPNKQSLEGLQLRRRIAALRAELNQQLHAELVAAGIEGIPDKHGFHFAAVTALLEIARPYKSQGQLRWRVCSSRLREKRCLAVARLASDNFAVKDFVLFADHPVGTRGFTFSEGRNASECSTYGTLAELGRSMAPMLLVGSGFPPEDAKLRKSEPRRGLSVNWQFLDA
jgi:hypothetical protein